jgi:hypothetical protein
MARFQVGQLIIGYSFLIRMNYGKEIWTTSNIFNHPRLKVRFIVLECIEHHKVPITYADDRMGDGYIFKDQDGNTFNNQYPIASYGQVSDDNDWLFYHYDPISKERISYHLFDNYITDLLSSIYDQSRKEKSDKTNLFLNELREEFFLMVRLYKEFTGDKLKFSSMKTIKPEETGFKYSHGVFEVVE